MKALSALEAEQSPISVFTADIESIAEEEEELAKLVEFLDKASTANGMEISAEKTKLMINNTSGINKKIKVNRQKLRQSQTSSTWAPLYLMRAPSLRYSSG